MRTAMPPCCLGCNERVDLCGGYCFDCATEGERRAAHRSVLAHIVQGIRHRVLGRRLTSRISFSWAWERLTRTGDYAPDGEFERVYGVKL